MKTLWTIAALVGFVSVSLFGLFSMSHQGGHIVECLANKLNGSSAPCPEADPFGFASFHNNALKKISNLFFNDGLGFIYFMLLFLGSLAGFIAVRLFDPILARFPVVSVLKPKTGNRELEIRKWFSLHENSPSYI